MFHIVEKYKTPAQIVLGIIGLTFIGFGANNLSSPGSDYIVKVGDEKVSEHALQIAIQTSRLPAIMRLRVMRYSNRYCNVLI